MNQGGNMAGAAWTQAETRSKAEDEIVDTRTTMAMILWSDVVLDVRCMFEC